MVAARATVTHLTLNPRAPLPKHKVMRSTPSLDRGRFVLPRDLSAAVITGATLVVAILVLGWLTSGLITGVWSPREQVASVTDGAVTLASPSDRSDARPRRALACPRSPARPAAAPQPRADAGPAPPSAAPRRARPPARRRHAGPGRPGARRHADRDARAGGDRRARSRPPAEATTVTTTDDETTPSRQTTQVTTETSRAVRGRTTTAT